MSPPTAPAGATESTPRAVQRAALLAQRREAAPLDPAARATRDTAWGAALAGVLAQLEPELLGLYWPIRGEFDAAQALRTPAAQAAWPQGARTPWALPWSVREGRQMHYRRWAAPPQRPDGRDEEGIPAPAAGAPQVPDVVLVPCLGFNTEGFRLGYGGGYFDRWLAAHPHVTAVGVALRAAHCAFDPEPHDQPLVLVVTEGGVWTGA